MTHVFCIRLSDDIHRMMGEMKDVNWTADIRQEIEELVKQKRREKILRESDPIRKLTGKIGVSAADLIREDRDAR
jgi:hypothetical protein